MFVAKVTGVVVATQKVDSMVGHKLLVVEPYRLDADDSQAAGHHRAHVRGGRHGRRWRRRIRADHPRLERPADARDQESAVDTVIVGIVDTVHVDHKCVLQPREQRVDTITLSQTLRTLTILIYDSLCKPLKQLIRSVVQEVLARIGTSAAGADGRRLRGPLRRLHLRR